MIEKLLTILSSTLNQSLNIALIGAFFWGIASILLSPCHLASIPLVIGFITDQKQKTVGKALKLTLVFALGILFSVAMIGLITAALGRMLGDVGKIANRAIAILFFIFGFYLMDLLPLHWNTHIPSPNKKGLRTALLFGLIFGVALGPCTFGFMAPVLGLVFTHAAKDYPGAVAILGAFALGHCSMIVLAGTLTQKVQNYLSWKNGQKTIQWLKRCCGFLVLLAGIYLLLK